MDIEGLYNFASLFNRDTIHKGGKQYGNPQDTHTEHEHCCGQAFELYRFNAGNWDQYGHVSSMVVHSPGPNGGSRTTALDSIHDAVISPSSISPV